jgi:hypothetical protein
VEDFPNIMMLTRALHKNQLLQTRGFDREWESLLGVETHYAVWVSSHVLEGDMDYNFYRYHKQREEKKSEKRLHTIHKTIPSLLYVGAKTNGWVYNGNKRRRCMVSNQNQLRFWL